nr:hypothetical protein CFP56_25761 [Quercus suber]
MAQAECKHLFLSGDHNVGRQAETKTLQQQVESIERPTQSPDTRPATDVDWQRGWTTRSTQVSKKTKRAHRIPTNRFVLTALARYELRATSRARRMRYRLGHSPEVGYRPNGANAIITDAVTKEVSNEAYVTPAREGHITPGS